MAEKSFKVRGRCDLLLIGSVLLLTALFYLTTSGSFKFGLQFPIYSKSQFFKRSSFIKNQIAIWENKVPSFFIYDVFYRGGDGIPTFEKECEQFASSVFCTTLFSSQNRTSDKSKAKLFLIPLFESLVTERESLVDAIARLKRDRYFLKFGGSDFIFACYAKCCDCMKRDLIYALGKFNRGFWISSDTNIEWPCKNRILTYQVDNSAVSSNSSVNVNPYHLGHALEQAGRSIEGRERWRCEGKSHWGLKSKPLLDFGTLNTTTFYSEEHKVVYCGVPKVGSSVSVLMMRRMNRDPKWKQSNTLQIRHFETKYNWTFQDEDHVFRLYNDTQWVRGMLVRDPVSRFLSWYRSKIESLKSFEMVPGHWNSTEPPTFEEIVYMIQKVKERGRLDHLDRHSRPQSSLCGARHLPYEFIGRYENREEDIKDFLSSVELWESIGATGWGVNGTTAIYAVDEQIIREDKPKPVTHADSKSVIRQYYTEDLMKIVMELYDEDYRRFGFSKNIGDYF